MTKIISTTEKEEQAMLGTIARLENTLRKIKDGYDGLHAEQAVTLENLVDYSEFCNETATLGLSGMSQKKSFYEILSEKDEEA